MSLNVIRRAAISVIRLTWADVARKAGALLDSGMFHSKSSPLFFLGVLFASCLLGGLSPAATLLSDNFNDGNRDGWYLASDQTFSATVPSDKLLIDSAATSGSTGGLVTAYFTATTLGIGDSITLSGVVSPVTTETGTRIRMGLFNSGGVQISADQTSYATIDAYAGYVYMARQNGTGGTFYRVVETDDGGFPLEAGASTSTGTQGFNAADLAFSYTLTYTGTDITQALTINGVSSSASSIAIDPAADLVLTFDTVMIGAANTIEYSVDDVVVSTTVPEPGTVGLALAPLGWWLAFGARRRKGMHS